MNHAAPPVALFNIKRDIPGLVFVVHDRTCVDPLHSIEDARPLNIADPGFYFRVACLIWHAVSLCPSRRYRLRDYGPSNLWLPFLKVSSLTILREMVRSPPVGASRFFDKFSKVP